MKKPLFFVLVVPVLLAACQTVPGAYTTQFQREGKPPAYIDGHADGCRTGFNATGSLFFRATKDPQRFMDDAMYAQGWKDGYDSCKTQGQLDP